MLCDREIRNLCRKKNMIFPFEENQLQPNSYDITLANRLKVISDEFRNAFDKEHQWIDITKPYSVLEKENKTLWRDIVFETYVLAPGECVLGSTREAVTMPSNVCARVEGKSSLGRWFICNHMTAGYIDAGFVGTITLEIKNNFEFPLLLRAGMLIGQLAFAKTKKCQQPYNGKYMYQYGPEQSKYYLNY